MENYHNWLLEEKTSFLKLVREILMFREWSTKKQLSEDDLQRISKAFDIAANCHHSDKPRDSWDPYITHPIAVARILLQEFQDTNVNQILVALLHDTVESNPQSKKIINKELWKVIAKHVLAISKKDPTHYLSFKEKVSFRIQDLVDKIFSQCLHILIHVKRPVDIVSPERKILYKKLKIKRDHDYFSWLDRLHYDELCVKIADRLHNLRTIQGCDTEKQRGTTEGTHTYFLHVVKSRCPNELDLLVEELCHIDKNNVKKKVNNFLMSNGVDPRSFYEGNMDNKVLSKKKS